MGGERERERNWILFLVYFPCSVFAPRSEAILPALGLWGMCPQRVSLSLLRTSHLNDSLILYSTPSLSFPKPFKPILQYLHPHSPFSLLSTNLSNRNKQISFPSNDFFLCLALNVSFMSRTFVSEAWQREGVGCGLSIC